jgi:Fe-S-cluster-containing dehydrogenase component
MTRHRPHSDAPWRSLEALASPEDPQRLERRSREHAPGAAEPPSGPTRRTVLGLMGASMALAGLTSCRRPVEKIVPYVDAPEHLVPGIPQQYATTLTRGTDALGVLVKAREGRPIKIEGNDLHPSSGGAADGWAQAAILCLYDPDRSRSVRKLAGEGRADGTWDEVAELWGRKAYDLEDTGGRGLGVLIEPYASPSIHRMLERLRRRFPEARYAVWGPVDDERIFEGMRIATGRPGRPLYHLAEAKVILTLDADLLLTETRGVANTRGFSQGRRGDGEMSRLYAVESTLSLTGANADHRLRLRSGEIPAFAAALAVALGEAGVSVELPAGASAPPLPEGVAERVAPIARDLTRAGSEAVIAAGRGQPPEVHALAWTLNQALGAVGTTVTRGGTADTGVPATEDLAALVEAMRGGEIETLAILGGNPVYDAPADLDFAGALEAVPDVFHLSSYDDETSGRAGWHLPRSHDLESWGDAVTPDGTRSVIQPLVAPLFDSRSLLEMLTLLATDEHLPGHRIVRATWTGLLGEDDFERRWVRMLHDGLAPETPGGDEGDTSGGPPAEVIGRAFALAQQRSAPGGYELTFQLCRSVHDGRFANLAWLQEMPDPITKITWDNAALVSPATAAELGVSDGDVVALTFGERSVELPVWRQPGQTDGSVAVSLGYGRTAAGRVGDGVGVDVYPLRTSSAPWIAGGVEVARRPRRHDLAQTQEHWEMEGRDLVRWASWEDYRRHPEEAFHREHHGPPLESLWPEPSYEEGYKWGMTVDLSACTGCNACVVACQSENNVPVVGREQVKVNREMHWLRVDRYFVGDESEPRVAFQPVPCQQCENAPCEEVCPVAATVHDAEGLNLMVYNRCIGTRYCSNNCPYKVRRFNFFNYTRELPELMQMAMNPDVTVRSRGVMEKCTYCIQRIHGAKAEAKRDGHRKIREGEIRTACQQTCPADAIVFGDLNDPDSRVVASKHSPRDYTLLEELNNQPRTTYLGSLGNPHPDWGGTAAGDAEGEVTGGAEEAAG